MLSVIYRDVVWWGWFCVLCALCGLFVVYCLVLSAFGWTVVSFCVRRGFKLLCGLSVTDYVRLYGLCLCCLCCVCCFMCCVVCLRCIVW